MTYSVAFFIIFAVTWMLARRAHGSAIFRNLGISSDIKRAVCSYIMAASAIAFSGYWNGWHVIPMMAFIWLYLAPGTSIGGIDGDKVQRYKGMLRELYFAPAIMFYAWRIDAPFACVLPILALPFVGLSYWWLRNYAGDSHAKNRRAELLIGLLLSCLLGAVLVQAFAYSIFTQ